ncbi:beta-phosphoglucomutase [Gloeothece verrucosa]|uniref:Beta-phosphoglucomutase n=1 Tax=Gloeothece verrucosa (strain PCC 7822) TaxID=497965 RepID=E0UH72_GLOV7|nr:beta-phosphoglucomutase [Gloeothece verrucosa]ADN16786.1 beta-phosphoglucomutase [Gloeothece verrucosa PCC 7822]
MDATAHLHLSHLIYSDWTLIESEFNPTQLHYKETVFTIGNGYLGTRGSFEEGYPGARNSTLIAGVYDAVPVVYTELANCPDWLGLIITIDEERFRLDQGEILSYERSLDLYQGLLSRQVCWRSPSGKILELDFERLASLADPHVLALRCRLTAINFDAPVTIQAPLSGYIDNQGYSHWQWIDQGYSSDNPHIWLHLRTRASAIELGMACSLNVLEWGAERVPHQESQSEYINLLNYPALQTRVNLIAGQPVTLEKRVTVYTSRDVANPHEVAFSKLDELPSYNELKTAHKKAWADVWTNSDIIIEGDIQAQFAVRYNLFQLLISASQDDDQVSIPAKTLSGFGYRGHVFWDTEIFILPFLTFTQPTIARNLLSYRYHTLNGARRKAKSENYKGAMFPWESADTGDEVTPRWAISGNHYDPDTRIWCRDREIHISADIAYGIWHYWQATGDDQWMRDYGAEVILDSAVFWGCRVEWNSREERYEIRHVIGADEYHEQVDNNAFTNRMIQWHLEKALTVYQWLQENHPVRADELAVLLKLTRERFARWQDVINNLYFPFDATTGLIEQYQGFFELEDINLAAYEPRSLSMQVILGIEGANQRQVLKQPDVLMLLYLMRKRGEFPYNKTVLQTNWDYYAPRTDITYGSSLGPAIHAILAADLGETELAYHYFRQAALVDLEDLRGNAHEGIHGACAGGLWQSVVFGFGGVQLTNSGPVATPNLPSHWTRLKFKLHWQGQWHEFDLRPLSSEQIGGVIFDLDGVLTDTAEYHYRGWQKLADEEGIPFDRQKNDLLRGLPRRESLLAILGDCTVTEDQLQEMMERKNRYYVQLIEEITPADLLPGVNELLEELQQKEIKIAIASASKNAQTVIERLGIGHLIDVICDGYSVQRSKPAPDLFLYAACQLDLTPDQCIVVEDAASGIDAASLAGMLTVGLGPVERLGKANLVLPNLENVHWADLIAGLSPKAKANQWNLPVAIS